MSSDAEKGYLTEGYINRLDELAAAIKEGDHDKIDSLTGELTSLRESSLFQELGKLTREIHESINAFSDDPRVAELASEDIPDAKERLQFIVTKTDEAAHRTMTNAEEAIDIVNNVNSEAAEVRERWSQFKNKEMSKVDFLVLSNDIEKLLSSVDAENSKVKDKMNDIMMAQDYQDLTGQMIKQVTTMVQEIEGKLVKLVAITGAKITEGNSEVKDGTIAHGPQLASANKEDVATNQDEVDDLLASLGF